MQCSVMAYLLQSHGLQPARLLYPWNSPGQNPRVGCISYSRNCRIGQSKNSGSMRANVLSREIQLGVVMNEIFKKCGNYFHISNGNSSSSVAEIVFNNNTLLCLYLVISFSWLLL